MAGAGAWSGRAISGSLGASASPVPMGVQGDGGEKARFAAPSPL
jgi:hypothetical protein